MERQTETAATSAQWDRISKIRSKPQKICDLNKILNVGDHESNTQRINIIQSPERTTQHTTIGAKHTRKAYWKLIYNALFEC